MPEEIIGVIDSVLKQSVGERLYYFGTIESSKVKNITFVPVIEASTKTYLQEDLTNGYQRPASPSRMRAFMKFLNEHPNSVVPPILLSSRGKWRFVPSDSEGKLGKLHVLGAASVIDGQHRLGGYVALFERDGTSRPVSFIVLEAANLEEEKEEFIVVNNSQKGVPRSLTIYLQDTEEAQVAWALNEDPDSPFANRIARATVEKRHLFALHSVAREIRELFKFGPLQELDPDTKIDFTQRYFTIISDVLQVEWADIEKLDDPASRGRRDFDYKLLELTGLIAWSIVGAHILFRSYTDNVGMNWDNVKRLVEQAAAVDWAKEGQYAGRTGAAGAKVISDDMLRKLPAEVVVNGDQ